MQKHHWKPVVSAVLAAAITAAQTLSTLPALAAEDTAVTANDDWVIGTVNLPYADYYYGELTDVTVKMKMDLDAADPAASLREEGYYDAVTSATNTKSVKYGATYYTENEDGSVTVNGIKEVAVSVPESLYLDAQEAIAAGETCNNQLLDIISSSMTLSEDQTTMPDEYKILSGDGILTAMIDANEAVTVSDADITISTNTTYGNYQEASRKPAVSYSRIPTTWKALSSPYRTDRSTPCSMSTTCGSKPVKLPGRSSRTLSCTARTR